MSNSLIRKVLIPLFACLLTITAWSIAPVAWAVNNPELLPNYQTPVIDLANFLPQRQEESLIQNLGNFETETGWKMRVLTQYDRTPGRAVKNYWNLDDKSILLVADGRGGNILAFSIGDAVYELLPRTFWIELQTRFGNMYYVRENGENKAIVDAIDSVQGCLKQGGCNVVPGLPREQWILTLVSSVVGGIILGFAAIPRQQKSRSLEKSLAEVQEVRQTVAWQWALIMSPLWGILFIAFGIGPVISRTSEWLPLLRNVLGFGLGAVVAYLSSRLIQTPTSEN